jgi:uncharacterized protein affecting Mg2+/Co2+ transport
LLEVERTKEPSETRVVENESYHIENFRRQSAQLANREWVENGDSPHMAKGTALGTIQRLPKINTIAASTQATCTVGGSGVSGTLLTRAASN